MGIRGSTVLFSSISVLFLIGFSLIPPADAATFTATKSGDWDDATTWGGTAPGTNIGGGDVINIPNGIRVTIPSTITVTDQTVTGATINNDGELLIEGTADFRTNNTFNNNPTGLLTITGTGNLKEQQQTTELLIIKQQ